MLEKVVNTHDKIGIVEDKYGI